MWKPFIQFLRLFSKSKISRFLDPNRAQQSRCSINTKGFYPCLPPLWLFTVYVVIVPFLPHLATAWHLLGGLVPECMCLRGQHPAFWWQ